MNKNLIKIVTTSWDDGHKLDLKLAKLLKKYEIPATFYIAPKNRQWDKKDLLTGTQIRDLSKNFEIGAHTITHPILTKLTNRDALKEIKGSKVYLEKLLGKKVNMFSYPSGLYSKDIKELVKSAGFLGARTIKTYRTKPPTDFFEMGTTNHSVNRNIAYSIALALANNPNFIPFLLTNNWVGISSKIFDRILIDGGIWHFWGHSWQVEENNWWKDLEESFSYVSKRPNFTYLTNSETINYLKKVL
jgi:peptidoglycan/xylan/chitin deacetylase (PgdA/CDA1 family)